MSLIKKKAVEQLIENIFEDQIVGISASTSSRRSLLIDLSGNSEKQSFYTPRESVTPDPAFFEKVSLKDTEELKNLLYEYWDLKGDKELLELPGPLASLREALRNEERQNTEISSSLYVMF